MPEGAYTVWYIPEAQTPSDVAWASRIEDLPEARSCLSFFSNKEDLRLDLKDLHDFLARQLEDRQLRARLSVSYNLWFAGTMGIKSLFN